MINLENARHFAMCLADKRRDLGAAELRACYESVADGWDADEDLWPVFRSAYFDALWAGVDEVATGPVVTGSQPSGRTWNLAAAGHLTLSFTASDRLKLIEVNLEFS